MAFRNIVKAIRIALLAACAIATALEAGAQETVNYASVSGRVTDPSGAVVPGAQVTARQTETNLTGEADHRRGRALPVSLPEGRAVRDHRPPRGVRRCHARS